MNVQVARPIYDVSNNGFDPTPVTPHINGVTPNYNAPVSG